MDFGESLGLIGGRWSIALDLDSKLCRLQLDDHMNSPYLRDLDIASGWVELSNWDKCWIKAHNLNKRYWFFQRLWNVLPIDRQIEFSNLRLLGIWECDDLCGFEAVVDHPVYTNAMFFFENTGISQIPYDYPNLKSLFKSASTSERNTEKRSSGLRALSKTELRHLVISADNIRMDENHKSLAMRSQTGWIQDCISNHLGECVLDIHNWFSYSLYSQMHGQRNRSLISSEKCAPLNKLGNSTLSEFKSRPGGYLEFRAYPVDTFDEGDFIVIVFRDCSWSIQAEDLGLRFRDYGYEGDYEITFGRKWSKE